MFKRTPAIGQSICNQEYDALKIKKNLSATKEQQKSDKDNMKAVKIKSEFLP